MSQQKLNIYNREGVSCSLFFLSFDTVSLKAGEKDILKDVSTSFFYDGLVLLKGRVGSGKTNILKMLAGLNDYDGLIIHTDKNGGKADCIFIHSVSEFNFITGYVGDELTFAGVDKSKFPHLVGRSVYDMSGGELKKLSIMMALARTGNSVILVDEPLDMLDDVESRAVADLIIDSSRERPFIIATHDNLFDDMADVILYID